jgi:hypothetical protein
MPKALKNYVTTKSFSFFGHRVYLPHLGLGRCREKRKHQYLTSKCDISLHIWHTPTPILHIAISDSSSVKYV